MRHRHLKLSGLVMLGMILAETAAAQGLAQPAAANDQNAPRQQPSGNEPLFRFQLVDGSTITGKLSLPRIKMETEFGPLEIPVARLAQVVPGMEHRPNEMKQIEKFIAMLGQGKEQVATARDEMLKIGPRLRTLLRERRDTTTGKHLEQIDQLLASLDEDAEQFEEWEEPEVPLVRADTIETPKFVAIGQIPPQKFQIQTRYGTLTVNWGDVEQFERYDTDELPDVRKALAVDGSNLAHLPFKNSGIRVQPGDKVLIRASGRLSRSGSSTYASTPDGNGRLGAFSQSPLILGGALIAKVGSSAKPIRLGSKASFVARQSGVLQFGIGMPATHATRYRWLGKYDVTVTVLRGGD